MSEGRRWTSQLKQRLGLPALGGAICFSQSTDSDQRLFFGNSLTETPRNNVSPLIWASLSPVRGHTKLLITVGFPISAAE